MPIKTPGQLFAPKNARGQDRRVQKFFRDQHQNPRAGFPLGRPWWAWCETQVDGSDAMPVGELIPNSADMVIGTDGLVRLYEGPSKHWNDGDVLPDGGTFIKGWAAPWVPEPKYVNAAIAGLQGARFRFDYQKMRKEYEDANRNYYDLVNNEVFQKGWDAIPLYGKVPYVVRALKHIGAPPKSPKIPEAAIAGDPWLLGFSDEPNERLEKILATDNGRLAETPEENDSPTTVSLTPDELEALREMVAQKRARETKKAASAA